LSFKWPQEGCLPVSKKKFAEEKRGLYPRWGVSPILSLGVHDFACVALPLGSHHNPLFITWRDNFYQTSSCALWHQQFTP
ncbi:MAG TPA: hypothetical protein PK233_07440, partial [Candidatus Atribacteria bacterium]|nr:hypothetical protein [Candidatus Atribacteria bacterium]